MSKMIARYVVPYSGPDAVLSMICGASRGAARVKALPMPQRPHAELWDDEREPGLAGWSRVWYAASVGVAVLAVFAVRGARVDVAGLAKMLLSAQVKA